MMHGYKRYARRIRKPLGIVNAYEKRTDKPGRIGHGDGVNVAKLTACLLECVGNDKGNCFRMKP